MKRSEINTIIREAEAFMNRSNFYLPLWAGWTLHEWMENRKNCREIFTSSLGWDITDFGSGDFKRKGLVLFTLRNGIPGKTNKDYAEKIMVVGEDQETPLHFHWHKTEDIINRSGGNLIFELYRDRDGELDPSPFSVQIDGIKTEVRAGESLCLTPGMSLTLEDHIYHRFYGEKGSGTVLTGEVSKVNDDNSDNRFYEPAGRFPEIIEDEEPYRLLVNDYGRFLGALR
ncbi:MAG: D-lyxose/D-mannose family sugar isomerase [Spirochaetales bacterium]|nr:D-lyxose/D-mannose family sugar isomerase [Spirochaetales bacterium]